MILDRISSGTKLKIDGNHVITKLTRSSEKQQAFSSPGRDIDHFLKREIKLIQLVTW